MASVTTITTIRTALETLIKGLTPAAPHLTETTYRVGNVYYSDTETMPLSNIDREFSIGHIPYGEVVEFGIVDEVMCETTFELMIGHSKGSDIDAAEARRDEDIAQITQALQKKTNFPNYVWLIRVDDEPEPADEELHWFTTRRFKMIYSRAA